MLDEQEMIYVKKDGRKVRLSYNETRVLAALIESKPHIARHAEIVRAIYKRDITEDKDIDNLTTPISNLRMKLGSELEIVSYKGVGYRVIYKE